VSRERTPPIMEVERMTREEEFGVGMLVAVTIFIVIFWGVPLLG